MHEKWMQRAIDNALKAWGHTSPNPHVGAVIVKDGEVIAVLDIDSPNFDRFTEVDETQLKLLVNDFVDTLATRQ